MIWCIKLKSCRPARGVISIPALAFLIAAVFFVLSQAVTMVGNKAIDGQLVSDSVHALYVAESGVEYGWGRLTTAVEQKEGLQTVCNGLAGSGSFPFGAGAFQFQAPSVAPTRTVCTFRVMGAVGLARRTIEAAAEVIRVQGKEELHLLRWHEVLSDE